MIGVRVTFHGRAAVVTKHEPLGTGLCDAMIAFDDTGDPCWVASHELRRADGRPVPDRAEAIRRADEETLRSLAVIRAAHVRDFRRPWPGCNFAKALIGQAIDGAIADVRKRITPTADKKK